MSEILRHLLNEEEKRRVAVERMLDDLILAAKNICDKYVAPDMYPRAMKEIEKVFQEQIQGHKRIR